jgi:hypothetical protein
VGLVRRLGTHEIHRIGLAVGLHSNLQAAVIAWIAAITVSISAGFTLTMEVNMVAHVGIACVGQLAVLWSLVDRLIRANDGTEGSATIAGQKCRRRRFDSSPSTPKLWAFIQGDQARLQVGCLAPE